MPKKKPLGWPELMTAKRLSTGVIAYYWAPPTRAKKLGCPVPAEALGNDYGAAKLRCDEILNKHYRAWAGKDEPRAVSEMPHGTFDWMVAVYKRSNRYTDLPPPNAPQLRPQAAYGVEVSPRRRSLLWIT